MSDYEPVLYIIMRNDLQSLNCGKAIAQGGHAVSIFHESMNDIEVSNEMKKLFAEWKDDRNFGTKIVLGANIDEIYDLLDLTRNCDNDILFNSVYDPTYPFWTTPEIAKLLIITNTASSTDIKNEKEILLTRDELTCMYMFGDKKVVSEYVKQLSLLP